MRAGEHNCSPALVVGRLAYKPGWTFKIGGPLGRFLCVRAVTVNSSDHSGTRATGHMYELPDPMPERDFLRWVFSCLLLAEQHEAGEFFSVDGFAPFYPNHQDEGSPYELVERWEHPC